jgi:hypothetical protein
MTNASQVLPYPAIRLPHFAMPKPQWPNRWPHGWPLGWPHVSPRTRAIVMMGLLISPMFLCDTIGYGIERIFYSSAQIAEMRQPDDTAMLRNVEIFPVACADPSTSAADQKWWTDFAAQKGWPLYPQAGEKCFRPERSLLGIVGLKTFNVACPKMLLTVADRGRWMHFAAAHGWDPYPQAGEDCVDP